MKDNYFKTQSPFYIYAILICVAMFIQNITAQDVNLKIHLSKVYSSKIGLIPLAGTGSLKPIIEKSGIKNGETVVLTIPKDKLPGQFVLRFDYEEKEGSTPYPSERYIFVNKQDLEFGYNPRQSTIRIALIFKKEKRKIHSSLSLQRII